MGKAQAAGSSFRAASEAKTHPRQRLLDWACAPAADTRTRLDFGKTESRGKQTNCSGVQNSSRSMVARWKRDRRQPDVGNLRNRARMLAGEHVVGTARFFFGVRKEPQRKMTQALKETRWSFAHQEKLAGQKDQGVILRRRRANDRGVAYLVVILRKYRASDYGVAGPQRPRRHQMANTICPAGQIRFRQHAERKDRSAAARTFRTRTTSHCSAVGSVLT